MTIGTYIMGIAAKLSSEFGGWTIVVRPDNVPLDGDTAWSVEIGVDDLVANPDDLYPSLPLLTVVSSATVRYTPKAATHDAWLQALDIAAAFYARIVELGAELSGNALVGADMEIAPRELSKPPWTFEITWAVKLEVSSEITIPGYVTTNPRRVLVPFEDDPDAEAITNADVTVNPRYGRQP